MSSERTEAPTPRRIREARDEGNVARSQELNAAAALLIGTLLLQSLGGRLINDIQSIMVSSINVLPTANASSAWIRSTFVNATTDIGFTVGLLMMGLLITGVSATVAQTGFLYAKKRKFIDLSRVNPAQGIKRLLSLQGATELIKAILKLFLVVWVAYKFLNERALEVLGLSQTDFRAALGNWAELALSLALRIGGAYLIIAVVDYAYQRWQYQRSLKMSKEEIKEEHKQQEGDPKTRARIRSEQRRRARMRMMSMVPQADVVITNPTHLAIAIRYDPEGMNAPVVLAKGAHLVAERIVEIAREHAIPITQDIPLARAIYNNVELDQEIPPDLYVAMAEVMAFVYRLRERSFSSNYSKFKYLTN